MGLVPVGPPTTESKPQLFYGPRRYRKRNNCTVLIYGVEMAALMDPIPLLVWGGGFLL